MWFLRGPGTKLPSEVEALKSKPTQPLLICFSMYQKLAVASLRFSWEIGHGCLDHALDRKVMFAYECHPIFAKSLSVQKFLLQPRLLAKTDEDGFATFDIRLFLFGLGAFFHLWQEKRKLVVKACSGKIRYE